MTRKENPELKSFGLCTGCFNPERESEILIFGYSAPAILLSHMAPKAIEKHEPSELRLCLNCATQLARKLLEDLSAYTDGGRHG